MITKVNRRDLDYISQKKQVKEIMLRTQYGFLLEHNGLRRGKLHCIISTSSGGKSTLSRSMIVDLIKENNLIKNVGLILSEEGMYEVTASMEEAGLDDKGFSRLDMISYADQIETMTMGNFLFELESFITSNKIGILFIDNLTTLSCYVESTPAQQSEIVSQIKRMAITYGITTVLVMHTGGNVMDNAGYLIDQNQVHGGKGIVRLAEFFYVLQKFTIGDTIFSTLRITKNRGFNIQNAFYSLVYEPNKKIYSKDVALNFEDFKEMYSKRNRI